MSADTKTTANAGATLPTKFNLRPSFSTKTAGDDTGVRKTEWTSHLRHPGYQQEIEPSVLALGTVFATLFLVVFVWTIV